MPAGRVLNSGIEGALQRLGLNVPELRATLGRRLTSLESLSGPGLDAPVREFASADAAHAKRLANAGKSLFPTIANPFSKLGVQLPRSTPDSSWQDTAAPIAAGVGAAAPFAGLIGQKPVIHDPLQNPNIKRYRSRSALERVVQPGDLLVMGHSGQTGWKTPQLLSGTEWYHGGAVPGTKLHVTPRGNANEVPTILQDSQTLGESANRLTTKSMQEAAAAGEMDILHDELPRFSEGAKAYENVTVLRPKTPLTPEQLETFRNNIVQRSMRPYDDAQAVKNWFRDIFVPKVKALRGRHATQCQGNICATLPAQAHHEAGGKPLLSGVHAQHVTPADFLRSPELQPVGAYVSKDLAENALKPSTLKAIKWGGRAGMGLGLGAAAYGTTKDPTLAAVPIGAVALPYAARKLHEWYATHAARQAGTPITPESIKAIRKATRKALPTIDMGLLHNMTPNEAGTKLFKSVTRRTLPLIAAGGLGAWLAARKAKQLIQGDR